MAGISVGIHVLRKFQPTQAPLPSQIKQQQRVGGGGGWEDNSVDLVLDQPPPPKKWTFSISSRVPIPVKRLIIEISESTQIRTTSIPPPQTPNLLI